MSVRVFAPAKINLTLEVGRPRADGLHPLQSVVVFADVGDIVEAEPAEGLNLTISGEFAGDLAADESNLVLRAARDLQQRAGGRGAALYLEKNLPVASGIGGGSADAAAALRALVQVWELNIAESELAAIALGLGADVPVCLSGAPAYVTGAGEHVAAISLPPLAAVLVNPLQPLPTADVYRAFDRATLGGGFAIHPAPAWKDQGEALAGIRASGNNLEIVARERLPAIGEIAEMLRADARVLHAAISGSGATMFALTADMDEAASLADDLQSKRPDWWVAETLLGGA